METFTPFSAIAGGALIGLSAAILWVANGRIAGISGILGGLLAPLNADFPWRAAFVAGILLAPLLYRASGGTLPDLATPASLAVVLVAGVLVGFGTRLGSGCTSGHGVCGLARLALVLLSAVGVSALGVAIADRRKAPLLAKAFSEPLRQTVDRKLLLGAALFGVGWGLVGYCPGPALAAVALGAPMAAAFVAAMLVGMGLFTLFERRAQPTRQGG
jgi:uncharacterized membrane protein YedE/YeeE